MSPIGWLHTLAATISLISGTYVLIADKGGKRHKQAGYVYTAAMGIMLITAFMIYRLFGGFGIFHIAAVVSSATLILGMVPAIRRSSPKWVIHHFSWMYWSVFGLYGAFAGEVLTRLPNSPFFTAVGASTAAVMLTGSIIWRKMKPRWEAQFMQRPKKI
ncbi:DUF2306 domain-containing protein [Roseivirga sp. BDSF3-8]|uniref:DUF2306 domain-containing protein n=1 Tax=Roseivirga sp. BDSF3-8 TaxID=3241598 RepID=UPI003531CFAA